MQLYLVNEELCIFVGSHNPARVVGLPDSFESLPIKLRKNTVVDSATHSIFKTQNTQLYKFKFKKDDDEHKKEDE